MNFYFNYIIKFWALFCMFAITYVANAIPLSRIDSYNALDFSNPLINPANLQASKEQKKYEYEIKLDFGFEYVTSDFSEYDELDRIVKDANALQDNFSFSEAQQLFDDANDLIERIADQFYFAVNADIETPVAFYFKTTNAGTFSIGQSLKTETEFKIYFNSLRINPLTAEPDISILPYVSHVSIQDLYWNHAALVVDSANYDLHLGYRGKLSEYKLYHQALFIDSNNFSDFDNQALTYLNNQFGNRKQHSVFNLDVGAHLDFNLLSAGVQIRNILEQSLSFNQIGVECNTIKNEYGQQSCWSSRLNADRIAFNRQYRIAPTMVIHADIADANQTYRASIALSREHIGLYNQLQTWAYVSASANWNYFNLKLNVANLLSSQQSIQNVINTKIATNYYGLSIELFNFMELSYFVATSSVDRASTEGSNLDALQDISFCGSNGSTNCYIGIKLGVRF